MNSIADFLRELANALDDDFKLTRERVALDLLDTALRMLKDEREERVEPGTSKVVTFTETDDYPKWSYDEGSGKWSRNQSEER